MKKLSLVGLAGGLLALFTPQLSAQVSGTTQGTLENPGVVFGANYSMFADSDGTSGLLAAGGVGTTGVQTVYTALQSFTFKSSAAAPNGLGLPAAGVPVQLFCIQIEQFTQNPQTVVFQDVAGSLTFRGATAFDQGPTTADRQGELVKLYSAVFSTGYNPSSISFGAIGSAAERALAFQLAVWNVIYGGGLGTNGSNASLTDASEFFQVNANNTVTTIANNMLNAAWSATPLAGMTLWALRSPVGSETPAGQDFAIPFYNDTPGQTTPEPSTYALLVGVATLGVVSLRRRFKRVT